MSLKASMPPQISIMRTMCVSMNFRVRTALVMRWQVRSWKFLLQAEVGMRDCKVTGVQTCALPIYVDVPARIELGLLGGPQVEADAAVDPAQEHRAHALLVGLGDKLRAAVLARRRSVDRARAQDRKSTRLNSSHLVISYAAFCLQQK